MEHARATLQKQERLCSKKLIEALFNGDRSTAVSAYPLRAVFMTLDNGGDTGDTDAERPSALNAPKAAMLVSVPKHCFKRAVKRNRIKRLVREAFRKHKLLLGPARVAIAFIWTGHKMPETARVEQAVVNLLQRIAEKNTP